MNVLYVFSDNRIEWNCSEWRCLIPTLAINTTIEHKAQMASIANFANGYKDTKNICEWADVIVIQRDAVGPVIVQMEYWKSRGKTIVLDLDDDYFNVPLSVRSYKHWVLGDVTIGPETIHMPYPPIEQLKWAAKLVHAITSPSALICKDWLQYGTNTYHVPNWTFPSRYDVKKPEKDNDRITIGWGGSLSHLESFRNSGVRTALNRILRSNPNVDIKLAGGDMAIYNLFDCPPNRKTMEPWVEPVRWPSILATFDIGIAPLAGKYDDRRSWIKGMEYQIMGIPWVGSKAPPFDDLMSGHVCTNTPGEWEKILQYMIDNLEEERNKAKIWQEDITQFDIEKHVDDLIDIYKAIRRRHEQVF